MKKLLNRYLPIFLSVTLLTTAGFFWLNVNKAHAAFAFSKKITVQTGKVPTTQINFPMNVNGTFNGTGNDPDLRTVGNGGGVQNANGYDVGFYTGSDCSTGKMTWETVLYTATTGTVEYWVLVPSILDGAVFYICFGDASITTDQSNKTAVWDVNYQQVLHTPDGTTLSNLDSTSNGFNTTITGATATTGQIDGGAAFSGTGQWFTTTANIIQNNTDNYTVEAWVKVNAASGTQNIFSSGSASSYRVQLRSDGSDWNLYHQPANTNATFAGGVTANTWTHVIGTWDGSNIRLYVNGVLKATTAVTSSSNAGTLSSWAQDANDAGGGIQLLAGSLDEMRVSKIARSTDWITTEYNNQLSPSTFYAFANNPQGTTPTKQIVFGRYGAVTITGNGSVTIKGY